MPWTKLDDGFATNPKIARLADTAFRLYVHGLVYSVQNLTDGRIDEDLLEVILPKATRQGLKKSTQELESGGLWIAGDGGWHIKDFAEYQPTKADVEAQRERWRKWKQEQRKSQPSVHKGQTEDKQRTPQGSQRATVPSRPVPIEPLPTVEVAAQSEIDVLKSTLVELFGEPAPNGWKVYQRIATYIRDKGGTPDEMRFKAGRIAEEWGVKASTALSLEKHWNRHDAAVGQLTDKDVKKYRAEIRRLERRKEITDGT